MKKILLTGCNKGIGNAILKSLLFSNEYEVYAIVREIRNLPLSENLFVYEADLSVSKETERVIQEIISDAKDIDILINNAGIGKFDSIENISLEDWNEVMNVNLVSPFILIKNIIPKMKKRNTGQIINISSDADHLTYPRASLYCASKFGLVGLSDSVRKELKGTNIKITTIEPGRVDTNFNDKNIGDRPNSLKPEDVANEVMHILGLSKICEIEKIYLNSVQEKQ